jgi:hypothetical protein
MRYFAGSDVCVGFFSTNFNLYIHVPSLHSDTANSPSSNSGIARKGGLIFMEQISPTVRYPGNAEA